MDLLLPLLDALLVPFAVFAVTYAIVIITVSVGYHRGLAHGAVTLHPLARKALLTIGPWITCFDPKSWVVMHRMHHQHSDTVDDPHSPRNVGFFGIFREQADSYIATHDGLLKDEAVYADVGRDLEQSWSSRTKRWWAPYLLHAVVVAAVGFSSSWLLALALLGGLQSHVAQGAIINYFGHAHGGRNFDTDDDSRNNHMASWLVLGEGFQNNHHRYPSSARFSHRAHEVDMGYAVVRALAMFRVLTVVDKTLMPRAARS